MKEVTNDIFMDVLNNPTLTLTDYEALGVTPERTQLKDESVYKRNEKVKQAFTNEEGKFDEKAFHDFYQNMTLAYNLFSTKQFANTLIEQTNYDPDNIFAPKNGGKYNTEPLLIRTMNPDRQSFGFVGINKQGRRTKSQDEIAQGEKVLKNPVAATRPDGTIDESIAEWDDAPGEGIFSKQFWRNSFETRVLAMYDEDGYHPDPITGEMVEHKKGQLKLNKNGTYYYENLDGRDVYGRLVLNNLNILTKEGTKLNDYDFFDSDDIEEKNVGASILKNLALVGSMFIPGGVGLGIAAISAGTLIAGMLSTLGKMVLGSDSPNLSAIEGWAQSWNRQYAKTEYAREHTWCLENFIDTFSDLVALLRELRAIFELVPGIIKGTPLIEEAGLRNKFGMKALEEKIMLKHAKLAEAPLALLNKTLLDLEKAGNNKAIEAAMALNIQGFSLKNAIAALNEIEAYLSSYNKIGAALSKTYMAGLISLHMYGEAKSQGLSDTEAMAVTLGRFLAEEALLNTPIGDYIFPELRYDKLYNKKMADSFYEHVKDTFNSVKTEIGSQEKAKWFTNIVKQAHKFGLDMQAERLTAGGLKFMSAFALGTEAGLVNDIEEGLNDLAIGTYNTLNWLGTGHEMKHNEEYFDRYAMGFASGLVGGGITSYVQNMGQMSDLSKINKENVMELFVYMHRNGKIKDFLKFIDKYKVADDNLSGIPEGNGFKMADDKTPSQNEVFRRIIHNLSKLITDIIEEEHANLTDLLFKEDILLQKDMRLHFLLNSPIASRYLQEFNSKIKKIVELKGEIETLSSENKEGAVDSNKNKVPVDNELLTKKTQELKLAQEELQAILEGKKAGLFFAESLADLTLGIKSLILPELSTKELYMATMTGRTVDDLDKLSPEEKTNWEKAWDDYNKSGINVEHNLFIAKTWIALNLKLAGFLLSHEEAYKQLATNNPYQLTIDTINLLLNDTLLYQTQGLDATDVTQDMLTWGLSTLNQENGLLFSILSNLNVPEENGLSPIIGLKIIKGYNETITKASESASLKVSADTKLRQVQAKKKLILDKYTSLSQIEARTPEQETEYQELGKLLIDLESEELEAIKQAREADSVFAEDLSVKNTYFINLLLNLTVALLELVAKPDYINPVVKTNILAILDKVNDVFFKSLGYKGVMNDEALQNLYMQVDDLNEKVLDKQFYELLVEGYGQFSIESYNTYVNAIGNDINGDSYPMIKEYTDLDPDDKIFPKQLAYDSDKLLNIINLRDKFNIAVEEFKKSLSTKTNTPVFDFLKTYATLATGNLNIIDILNTVDNIWRKNLDTLENAGNEDDLLEGIPEAKRLLALAKASVVASRTDVGGFMDLFNGFNAAVNNYNTLTENYVPLYEMTSEVADIINADIDTVYLKLRVVEKMLNANATRKLNGQHRVATNLSNIIYNRMKGFLENIENLGMQEIKTAFDNMVVHSRYVGNEDLSRSEEERVEQEKEMLALLKAIYNWGKSDAGLKIINNEDALVNLFKNKLNLFDTSVSVLDEKTKGIDTVAFVNWLTTSLALDQEAYNGILKTVIEELLVPVPTLNEVVRLMLALHVNKPLFTKIQNALRRAAIEEWKNPTRPDGTSVIDARKKLLLFNGEKFYNDNVAPYILAMMPLPQWNNVSLSEGGAGVGKSTGVLKYHTKMLSKVDPKSLENPWFVSVASENKNTGQLEGSEGAEAMAKTAGVTKFKTFNHAELKKALLLRDENGWDYNEYGLIIAKNVLKANLAEAPSAIFIDEVSHLSFLDLDAISQVASELGIDVYTYGDTSQTGVDLIVPISELPNGYKLDAKLNLELSSNLFTRTFKLGVSMRTANEQLNANNAAFIEYFKNPKETPSIKLRYYLDENSFKGTKFYDMVKLSENTYLYAAIDLAILDVKQMITLALLQSRDDFKKVGYIARTDQNGIVLLTPLYKALKNDDTIWQHLVVYPGTLAQGREAAYFIAEINPEDSLYDKRLYTGITRASEGTLLYTSRDLSVGHTGRLQSLILEGPDPSSKPDSYTDLSKKIFAEGRFKVLNTIAPNENYTIEMVSETPSKNQPNTFTGKVIPSQFFDDTKVEVTKDSIKYTLKYPVKLSKDFITEYVNGTPEEVVLDYITLKVIDGKVEGLLTIHDAVTNNTYNLKNGTGGINSIEELTNNKIKTPAVIEEFTPSQEELDKIYKDLATLKENELEEDYSLESLEDDTAAVHHSSFSSPEVPLVEDENAETIDWDSVFYTFNNLYLGAKVVDDSENKSATITQYEGATQRLDQVNGLVRLNSNLSSIVYDKQTHMLKQSNTAMNKLQIEDLLSGIWRAIMFSPSKKDMILSLGSLLLLKNLDKLQVYVNFGFQNRANFSGKNKGDFNMKPDEKSDFSIFSRHREEKSIHNPINMDGDANYGDSDPSLNGSVPVLNFVATVGVRDRNTGLEYDIIEIPIFTYNSPVTVLQLKVFKDLWETFNPNDENNPTPLVEGLQNVSNVIKTTPSFKKFMKLAKIIDIWIGRGNDDMSYNDYWQIHDDNWIPFGHLNYKGAKFTTHKGVHNFLAKTPKYDLGINGAQPLELLYTNTRFTRGNIYALATDKVFDKYLGSIFGTATDKPRNLLTGKGHGFILAHSLDDNLMTKYLNLAKIIIQSGIPIELQYFNALLENPDGIFDTLKLPRINPIWVKTPTVPVSQYMENINRLITNDKNYRRDIGDDLTIYRVWKALINNENGWNQLLNSSYVHQLLLKKIKEKIGELDKVIDDYHTELNNKTSGSIENRREVDKAWKKVTEAFNNPEDWMLARGFDTKGTNTVRYLLLGALHEVAYPRGIHDTLTESTLTDWNLKFMSILTESYKDGVQIHLKHGGKNTNIGQILVVNSTSGKSDYFVYDLEGHKLPILVPGKVDSETLTGKITYTDLNNQLADFIDYVHENLMARKDSKLRHSTDVFRYKEKRGTKLQQLQTINLEVQKAITNIKNSNLDLKTKDLFTNVIAKAQTIDQAIELINKQNSPIKAVRFEHNSGNLIALFDTTPLGGSISITITGNTTNIKNVKVVNSNGVFKVVECLDGKIKFERDSSTLAASFINKPTNASMINVNKRLFNIIKSLSPLLLTMFRRLNGTSSPLLTILDTIYTDETLAFNALTTCLLSNSLYGSNVLNNILNKLDTTIAEDAAIKQILDEKLKLDELNKCNTGIVLKLI